MDLFECCGHKVTWTQHLDAQSMAEVHRAHCTILGETFHVEGHISWREKLDMERQGIYARGLTSLKRGLWHYLTDHVTSYYVENAP